MTTILVAATLLSAASGVAAAERWQPIHKVDSAAAFVRGNRMTIIASGAVSTGGWSKARLRMKPDHTAEAGTLEFEFLAVPPPADETVIQVLVPATVTLTTHLPPYGVTEIRIDAQSNSTTAKIRR